MIITCNESSKSKIKVKVFTITFSRKRLMQFNVLRSSDRPTPPPHTTTTTGTDRITNARHANALMQMPGRGGHAWN